MATPRLGSVVTAMVTPFDASGEIDFSIARDLARYLVDQGNDGLVVAGSTGEGTSLSDDEKLDLFACVAESVTVPVIAGSTGSDTARSVALTAKVAQTGAAAVLATTPAYARPSQRGIALHMSAVANATELPLMLYDIPSRTGRKIAAETTISLVRDFPHIVALKDASADLASAASVQAACGDSLDLYSGDDSLVMAFCQQGAVGVVSVAGHWAAPEFQQLIRATRGGDLKEAESLRALLEESCTFEGTEEYPNPMPSKAAMRYLGFAVGECRLPHAPSDDVLNTRAAAVVSALHGRRG